MKDYSFFYFMTFKKKDCSLVHREKVILMKQPFAGWNGTNFGGWNGTRCSMVVASVGGA